MSLNTLSTGNTNGLYLPPMDDSSSSGLIGCDSSMNDSDLLLAMDNLFLEQIYRLIAAVYGNGPSNGPSNGVSGSGTPSADDIQAGQPIEQRTSWPTLPTPFDAKDIKGDDAPPAMPGSSVTWDGGTLTPSQLQIVSTLNQHRDKMPVEFAKLDEKINDPSTPPDLKKALEGLKQDPGLFFAMASQGHGKHHHDDQGKCNGRLIADNLYDFADRHPQVSAMGGKNATFNPEKLIGKTPPPAAEGSTVTWDGGTLTQSQLDIVSTLNQHRDMTPIEFAKLDEKINDPSTPPDLKKALEGLQQDPGLFFAMASQGHGKHHHDDQGKCNGKLIAANLYDFADRHPQVTAMGGKNATYNPEKMKGRDLPPPVDGSSVTWDGGTLTQNELEIVTTLDRHKDKLPLAWADLDAKINDPATPPDLKKALTELQNDPRLFFAIGSQGDGKCGGKIKSGDLSKFSAGHSQVAEYATKQAKGYTQNYVASDSPDKAQPTVMTESDAMREFYRYSDYLPKDLNQDAFKQLVEGDSNTQKCPPQVIAAAQYFREHPDQWTALAGDSGSMSTPDFLQKSASQMHLTAPELKTLDTINSHRDAFFGDGKEVTRDKLDKIISDDKADPAVRDAAKQLSADPLLFGLLNNSITGYKKPHSFFGGGHVVDSGKISDKDFQQFYEHMTAANKTVDKAPAHAATSPEQKKAVDDMLMGKADQPDIKKKKKDIGTVGKGLHEFLKWDSKILDWASVGLSALNGIPVIGEFADAASLALEGEAQAAQVLDTALQGGDMSLAWKLAGINMAGAVVGAVGGPTARLAAKGVAKGATEGAAKAASEGATKGATKGTTKGATKGTTEGATKGTTEGTTKGTTKGATKGGKPSDAVKGYVVGSTISKSFEMLKIPVMAGLHYEEVQLDKEKKKGDIRQNLEDAGGIPLGKQSIPKDVADNFEADTKENLRNLRGRRR
ncbi:HrpF/NolX family T3SS translocon protein [Xanthomonas vesicatoria]|uniref:Serine kinase n=1 Tax=Xanthomonas vesicatoria TaxID=56460 RepID=A0AAJ0IW28_9XANT|nr:HrpF/NolX family T3SS translocon protein [Xanthomonas vesicatoria]APO95025.1 serine kinase [Xanthomonas vesicatoria]KHM91354.1 serine kinase [Xanthomonas vesicatoria]KHM92165.1 serine kinase [Xanthomonas vesicatoria]MCC8622409.1 serine kinase [Xanthomonas vesicatoria]MCC8693644.1 serine kinase [Xanthomonas vesicatoria]